MRAIDERAAAATRIRAAAPLGGLAFPAVLLVVAALAAALAGDAAGRGFLPLAAPTLLALVVVTGEFPQATVVVLAAIASGPLWALVGRGVASWTTARRGAVGWPAFWKTYSVIAVVWTVLAVAVLSALER